MDQSIPMSLGDQMQIKDGELMAAVDIGSNSFHTAWRSSASASRASQR
jgi:hypothetical protein